MNLNEPRTRRLIDCAVATFDLNLRGLVVLTEAATGVYQLTPLIASVAGADRVLALSRDSRYGSVPEITKETFALAKRLGISGCIEIITSREDKRLSEADIVTNLGFVRPLDKAFLSRLNENVVIPLMWETWEYREEDLDLNECRRLGISVLGTNEHHPDLDTFKYIGQVAVKLLHEANIEIYRACVTVLGEGEFAEEIVTTLEQNGCVVNKIPADEKHVRVDSIRSLIEKVDALVVAEHRKRELLISDNAPLSAAALHEWNPGLTVIHICGNIDSSSLKRTGLYCYPDYCAPPGHMSVTTDYVGPRPLIDLHAAGLKVGQVMAEAVQSGLSGIQAETHALKLCNLAQGFEDKHGGVTL